MRAPSDCVPDDSWFSSWTLPGCQEPDSIATSVIKGSVLEPWVQDAKNGVSDAIKTMVTFWLSIPPPDVGNGPDGQSEIITFLQSRLAWTGAVIMCFVIAFQCVRMMFEQRAEPLKMVLIGLASYFAVALLAVPATVLGLLISAAVAASIIDGATIGTNFSDNLFSLFSNEVGFTSSILLLILLIIAMLLAGFQCILMIGRGGAVFVILGILLTTSAAAGLKVGNDALKTQIGWILALCAYPMTAAAIYGVGFRFLGTDTAASGNGMLQILYGLTLLMMAIFALPAMLRLCSPSTSPMAEGRGPGGIVAGAAPGLAAATMGRR